MLIRKIVWMALAMSATIGAVYAADPVYEAYDAANNARDQAHAGVAVNDSNIGMAATNSASSIQMALDVDTPQAIDLACDIAQNYLLATQYRLEAMELGKDAELQFREGEMNKFLYDDGAAFSGLDAIANYSTAKTKFLLASDKLTASNGKMLLVFSDFGTLAELWNCWAMPPLPLGPYPDPMFP